MTPFYLTGLFFVAIFGFGFWVSRAGKPYNTLLFNLHKLIGLAAGIYLIRMVYLAHQETPMNALQLGVIAFTFVIFVVLVIAGGLLSAEAEGSLKNVSPALLRAITVVHHVFPYLAVASTGGVLYLLLF